MRYPAGRPLLCVCAVCAHLHPCFLVHLCVRAACRALSTSTRRGRTEGSTPGGVAGKSTQTLALVCVYTALLTFPPACPCTQAVETRGRRCACHPGGLHGGFDGGRVAGTCWFSAVCTCKWCRFDPLTCFFLLIVLQEHVLGAARVAGAGSCGGLDVGGGAGTCCSLQMPSRSAVLCVTALWPTSSHSHSCTFCYRRACWRCTQRPRWARRRAPTVAARQVRAVLRDAQPFLPCARAWCSCSQTLHLPARAVCASGRRCRALSMSTRRARWRARRWRRCRYGRFPCHTLTSGRRAVCAHAVSLASSLSHSCPPAA